MDDTHRQEYTEEKEQSRIRSKLSAQCICAKRNPLDWLREIVQNYPDRGELLANYILYEKNRINISRV